MSAATTIGSRAGSRIKKDKIAPYDYLDNFAARRPPLDLDSQDFRFTAIRDDMPVKRARIDGMVETVEWRDEGNEFNLNTIPVLRGSMTLLKAEGPGTKLALGNGHVIRCDVRWGGDWEPYWEMRIQKPSVSLTSGELTFEMADDLTLASESTGTFRYKKAKNGVKKRGWLMHEIIRDVCKKWHIPLGAVPKGTKRLTMDEPDITPLEAIRQAVLREATWSGRKFVIRWAYSKKAKRFCLQVLPMRRNPLLYVFRDQILDAQVITGNRRDGTLCTAATGHGTLRHSKDGKKGKPTKLKPVEYVSEEGVKRYGYIHRNINLGEVDSQADVLHLLKREVAKRLKPYRQVADLSHPGIAFIRRGDALRLDLPEVGLSADESVLFVVSVIHNLSDGAYDMTLTLTYTDLLNPNKLKAEREKALRKQKRDQKGKKAGASAGAVAA